MVKGKDIKNNGAIIKLDKERKLKFDLNAFCELEELFGDTDTAFKALEQGSMKAIRGLLYAGLKSDDETLTLMQVGSMVTLLNVEEISTKISKALDIAMPEKEDNEGIEKNL